MRRPCWTLFQQDAHARLTEEGAPIIADIRRFRAGEGENNAPAVLPGYDSGHAACLPACPAIPDSDRSARLPTDGPSFLNGACEPGA
jgi:hypothetical protein